MGTVSTVLLFLLAVVGCGFLSRLLPLKLPLPLLQIAVGAALSVLGFDVALDPHVFLLLFIPPLLFLDGWRIPKGTFFREWRPILSLAIGLVVFTVVGIGYFVHWLVPTVPLAVAFALAAILSPTDPVALSAMSDTAPLPSRLMHILEGESLLNDASGLVCFSFAVTAALTGHFSLPKASLNFVMVAGGGVAVGVAATWAIAWLNGRLVKRTGEEPAIQMLVSLLIPFAAYLLAERMHVSGILAAAVAGIAMHYAEMSRRPPANTRMLRNAVWDTVQTALNGSIFVLLGGQLPRLLLMLPEAEATTDTSGAWRLLGYVLCITLALAALRFAWVWVSLKLTLLRRRGEQPPPRQLQLVGLTATAGVRGAITLAGVLTLPLAMPDGSLFPARDLAILLAMGVILMSLLIASIGLPLLARGLSHLAEPVFGATEGDARIAAMEAAVRRIEALAAEPDGDPAAAEVRALAATHVLDTYRRRLDYGEHTEEQARSQRELSRAEYTLKLAGLRASRDELYRLRHAQGLDDELHRRLVREIDLAEASLLQRGSP